MLTQVESNGESVGAIRTANGKDGSLQIERLQARLMRPGASISYTIEKTAVPVLNYEAEFRIDGAGEGASLVRWSVRFELVEGGDEEVVGMVRRFLQAGIENLKAKYGAGAAGTSWL